MTEGARLARRAVWVVCVLGVVWVVAACRPADETSADPTTTLAVSAPTVPETTGPVTTGAFGGPIGWCVETDSLVGSAVPPARSYAAVVAFVDVDPYGASTFIDPDGVIVASFSNSDPERDARLSALSPDWPVRVRQVRYGRVELGEVAREVRAVLRELSVGSGDHGLVDFDPVRNQVVIQLGAVSRSEQILGPLVTEPLDRYCLTSKYPVEWLAPGLATPSE